VNEAPRSVAAPCQCDAIVLGPDEIPRVQSVAEGTLVPELAVLCAVVHRDAPSAELALRAVEVLDGEASGRYNDLVWAVLPAAARAILEEVMRATNWEPLSDDFRRERAAGRDEGRAGALRQAIADLCAVLSIDWTAMRAAAVGAMGPAELDALWATLVATRRWPSSAA
jgi:hypothetical protein